MYDSLIIPFQIGFVNRFTQIYPYPSKSEYAKCPKKVAKRFRTCYNNRISIIQSKSMHSGYSIFPRLRRGNVGIPHAGKQPSAPLHTAAVRIFPVDERETSACFGHGSRRAVTAEFYHFQRPFCFPAKAHRNASGNTEAGGRAKAACCRAAPLRPFGLSRADGAETLNCLKTKHIVAGRRPPLRGPARFDRKGTKQQWHFCTHSAAA